jgi:hypothetical protein
MKETMQMGVFQRPAKPSGLDKECSGEAVWPPDDLDASLEPAGSR